MVYEDLKDAQEAGVGWPLPEGWDDRRLEEALFDSQVRHAYESRKPTPDFARLQEELQCHPHLTLQLADVSPQNSNGPCCRASAAQSIREMFLSRGSSRRRLGLPGLKNQEARGGQVVLYKIADGRPHQPNLGRGTL